MYRLQVLRYKEGICFWCLMALNGLDTIIRFLCWINFTIPTETRNIGKGRAVTSLELVKHYFQLLHGKPKSCPVDDLMWTCEQGPIEHKSGGRGLRVVNTMRKWCCPFKKRWQIRHGQMIEREYMNSAEIRDKARHV